jgi:hypothetical protein
MCYLYAIIDQCGKMVLGYRIAAEMTASLVTDTVGCFVKGKGR